MDFSKFYDEQPDYAAYRSDPQKLESYRIAIEWKVNNLARTVSSSMSFINVLEVGCALGILLNAIADRLSINQRFGIDISANNVQFASKKYPNCKFVCGTIEQLKVDWRNNFPIEKFDLVILSDIVEHIPDDEKFMEEVSTITEYVLLNLPLEKCYNNRNRKYGETDSSGHLRNYNLSDAKKLVKKSGFEIVSEFTDNPHFSNSFFKHYRENRRARVNGKPILRRVFWTIFYSLEEVVKSISPSLYKKKYGSNFFALLRVKR